MYLRQMVAPLCLALMLVLTGCDSSVRPDDEDDSSDVGEVTLEITGDGVSESWTGDAFFVSGTEPRTGEQAFIVYLVENNGQRGSFVYFGRNSVQPDTGSYAFADAQGDNEIGDQFTLFATVSEAGEQIGTTYLSAAGSLVLATSSAERVAGTFEVQGTGLQVDGKGEGEATVSITGEFDAPRQTQFAGLAFN